MTISSLPRFLNPLLHWRASLHRTRKATRRGRTNPTAALIRSEFLEERTLLASQMVTATPSAQTVMFNDEFVVDLKYDVSDSSVSALSFGFQLHYDSDLVQFVGTSSVLQDGSPTIQPGIETTSDGVPATDRNVTFSWGNGSAWPASGTTLPVVLGQVRFKALNQSGTTSLNFTSGDPDPNPVYDFVAPAVTVTLTPPTFVVGPQMTLAQAITAANATANPAVIRFDSTVSSVALPAALPQLTNDISIIGPDARNLTITAAAGQRVFSVAAGSTVNISGVTLDGADAGGGISNNGTLNLNHVAIRNSRFVFGGGNTGNGGAVANATGATLNVSNSEISGNRATTGGGIHNAGTAIIVNTTVSGNRANDAGGGISSSGAITLRNVTVTNNTATAARNGGVEMKGGTFVVRNSIVVGNLISNGSGNDTFPADITDVQNSITSGTASTILSPTLVDNGGPTFTHALVQNGPAIDTGDTNQALGVNGSPLSSDQRGRARVFGGGVDIGAFELVPPPGFTVTNPSSLNLTETGSSVSLSIVLDAPPAGSVVLSISSSDETESKPRFASVSFGPGNWNIPQIVPIDGVADQMIDGDQTSTITVSINDAASDDAFDALPDHTVTLTTIDDGTFVPAPLDVDGNGQLNPFTDGILIYLWMTAGTQDDTFATFLQSAVEDRNTAAKVRSYLDGLHGTNVLDVDGNGQLNPFTDGILIYLWMTAGTQDDTFATFLQSAVEDRNTAAKVRSYLDGLSASTSAAVAPQTAPLMAAPPITETSPLFDRESFPEVQVSAPSAGSSTAAAESVLPARDSNTKLTSSAEISPAVPAGTQDDPEPGILDGLFDLTVVDPGWILL